MNNFITVIIGAASGFGRSLSKQAARNYYTHSTDSSVHPGNSNKDSCLHLVLVGRSRRDLENLSFEISANPAGDNDFDGQHHKDSGESSVNGVRLIKTYIVPDIELSVLKEEVLNKVVIKCEDIVREIEEKEDNTDSCISGIDLIFNAGSLGDLSKRIEEYNNLNEISSFYNLNVVSFMFILSRLLDFGKRTLQRQKLGNGGGLVRVIQISSLLAVQAFPCWGLYASAKASRDMILAVLAKESETGNNGILGIKVKTLSYAPGPLNNDMQKRVRESIGDASQKEIYSEMNENKKLVSMDDSAKALYKVLNEDKYESGSHVDYYDVL
ncbi:hypothetical protein BB559_005202 [Furculomyces boomerangus]|uniref:Sepiapterin reductase n=2 Tax=Harpellales TaxID=61421 RepID=A0A2T9YA16_9FUNG|nr:hypothetical protein BB559_005202 [Furculomyces boomerangus]PVZ98414.1 hypothetical protein BB558_005586 [Smittium angustum]